MTEKAHANGTPREGPEPQPRKRGGAGMSPEGKLSSRRNALKDGLRSKVVFTEEMEAFINVRAAGFAEDLEPTTELEWYLVDEAAVAGTQGQLAGEYLLIDARRVIERAEKFWEDDRCDQADKIATKLHEFPHRTARLLERSKQGTDVLLIHWGGLEEALLSNNGWNEPQRQMAFDLLGVAHDLRDGSLKVPAGTDTPALQELVTREMARLRARQETTLNAEDRTAQGMAILGIPIVEDAVTRRLRRNEARAHRRLEWALSSLERLRMGADPSTVIDPETKQPPKPKPRPAPAPEPEPAPAPAAEAEAPVPSDRPLPPAPEGCSPEDREMLFIAGGELRAAFHAYQQQMAQRAGVEPPADPGPARR